MRLPAAVLLAALTTIGCSIGRSPAFPYQNPKTSVERRVEDLLRRMTPEEKLALLKGAPNQRLGIPAIHTDDGASAGRIFPPGIAMAAAWNPDLVAQEARVIARDELARGYDQVLGPAINTNDGYGEDPWLASRMTVAYVGALQGEGVIATLGRFPANNADGVKADERTLNEIYFPPFRAAVEEAGAWSIIPSSPSNPKVVTDVLEKDWGFKGFVTTPAASIGGTQDVDDDKVRRLLRAMFAAGIFERGVAGKSADSEDRRAIVWNAAVESIVLLKNDRDVLPLQTGKVHSIAVIGRALAVPGIRERAGTMFQVGYASGDSVKEASDLAQRSDVAIVAGPDDLIQAIASANRNTIAILSEGSPVHPARWINQVPALLSAWLPGQDSGHAIAAVVFGDFSPSGKLPFTFPRDSRQAAANAGIYVGYRFADKHNIEPLFPFGYGLSYTRFAYSDLKVFPATPRYGQLVQLALKVGNTGTRAGAEVVQVYVHDVKSSVDRPVKELKAFQRVELKAGETREVTFELDRRAMSFYDPVVKTWATEPGVFEVLVGASSRDIRLKGSLELFE